MLCLEMCNRLLCEWPIYAVNLSLKDKKDRVYLAIGHLRVDKITSRQIQQFINNLSEPGINKRYPDRGLSSKTQKGYLGFISDVFNYAIQFQIASYNPCHNIRIKSSEHEEQKIYTLEEAQNFLKLLEDTAPIKYKVFFSIALFTGLRRGEILGLEWKDIDFDTGVVSVRRTSLYTKDTGIYTDTPKTKRSERCFKVSEDMLCLFRSFKADQAEKRLALGDKWIDNDRLFTSWNGDPMGVDSARHWLTKFCKHNEIRYVNVHSFRHFFATTLIFSGVDIVSVSEALGHSQRTTTLNIYSHAFAVAQAKAQTVMETALRPQTQESKKA